ncbi:site-specific recombinase XerD [Catenuloplanes niger]|uniref:Site-specific recombinase XerD n=2 Tax=Micromonosporaceae TaxID=28056 RepID=A0AAE3ZNU7_9ACTN|nr:site-specific recombinase XerD [Catenuloplanes niger]
MVGYFDSLGQLARFHEDGDLLTLGRQEVEDFLLDITQERGLSQTTALVRFRDLRAFYNWAVAEELIDASPMARIPTPQIVDEAPAIVPDEDIRSLLKAASGRTHDDRRDTAIIRLWCEAGSPRVAEMAGIQEPDLDMRRDRVTLHGKGGKTRTIPFGASTGQAIDRYLRERRKHRDARRYSELWLGARGKPLGPSGLYQMLVRRCRQAGIGRIHPHQLRHTAAHIWKMEGGSDSDAMELFGWSSAEMPRVYGRSAANDRAQAIAQRKSIADRL